MNPRPVVRPAFGLAALLLAATTGALPASAQLGSEPAKFLTAVRDSDGAQVQTFLGKPGHTLINTQDPSTGETALHIVVRRDDLTYLNYLLDRDADYNLRNRKNESPLLVGALLGFPDMVAALAKRGASVNAADSSGQTPLIVAVLRHNLDMVRTLLELGADPDHKDLLQGFSARQYAQQDQRSTAIAQAIEASPKTTRRGVSGPKL